MGNILSLSNERKTDIYLATDYEAQCDLNRRTVKDPQAVLFKYRCPQCSIYFLEREDAVSCYTKNTLDDLIPRCRVGDVVTVLVDVKSSINGVLISTRYTGVITTVCQYFNVPLIDENLPTPVKVKLKHEMPQRFKHEDVWGEDVPCAQKPRLTLNGEIEISDCYAIRNASAEELQALGDSLEKFSHLYLEDRSVA